MRRQLLIKVDILLLGQPGKDGRLIAVELSRLWKQNKRLLASSMMKLPVKCIHLLDLQVCTTLNISTTIGDEAMGLSLQNSASGWLISMWHKDIYLYITEEPFPKFWWLFSSYALWGLKLNRQNLSNLRCPWVPGAMGHLSAPCVRDRQWIYRTQQAYIWHSPIFTWSHSPPESIR